MIDSISSYLYSNAIDSTTSKTSGTVNTSESTDTASSFASTLTSEISSYTALNELADTLSGSVLSTVVSNSSDLASLSEELLNTSSGRKVIETLAEGHLNSIVLSDDDDDDSDSVSISNTLDEYTEAVEDTSTLENIVDELASLVEVKEEE